MLTQEGEKKYRIRADRVIENGIESMLIQKKVQQQYTEPLGNMIKRTQRNVELG